MYINPLDLVDHFAVSMPVFAMTLVGIAVMVSRLKQFVSKKKPQPHRRRRRGGFAANAATGFAFLPLGIIYRPGLVEVAKAQIRQQEDADEDGNGDPDSPQKYLLRQLRRVRRGERVKTLFFRLK
jgi:hypothetical protein